MNWYFGFLGQITANDRLRMQVPDFADMEQHPYGWLSLMPPVVAIVLAILTRRVIVSLLVSIFVGAMILGFYSAPQAVNYEPSGWDLVAAGAVSTWYDHLWPTLLNPDKVSVFVFTCLMGAIVGMVNRAAGMRGLIGLMSPITNSRVGVQVSTWISGMFVFFDDYANTMLLGTTYRTVYDRMRVSREKLAYIVDSTAAPVAGLAIVSTWIAGELAYINDGLAGIQVSESGGKTSAFELFMASIPYRFYVIWALWFVLVSAIMRRDFGPMLKAERRALSQDPVVGLNEQFTLPADLDWPRLPVSNDVIPLEMAEVVAVAHDRTLAPQKTPARSINAILPILVTVVAILGLMYQSGLNDLQPAPSVLTGTEAVAETPENAAADGSFSATILRLGDIFGASDSYSSLVWGSVIGFFFTWFWLGWQRIVPSASLMHAAGHGATHMIPALAILWLASALSTMTSSDASESYQRELDQAKAIAKAIAATPKMGEAFATLDPVEQVAATLRLHKLPEPVIVETLAGQYADPNEFWDEVLEQIGDQSLGSGFYGRYIEKDGQQVNWDDYQKSLRVPPAANLGSDPSQAPPATSLIEESKKLYESGKAKAADDGSTDVKEPAKDNEETRQPPTVEETKESGENKSDLNDGGQGPQQQTDNATGSAEDQLATKVVLWPTSLQRQDQETTKSEPAKSEPANRPVTDSDPPSKEQAGGGPPSSEPTAGGAQEGGAQEGGAPGGGFGAPGGPGAQGGAPGGNPMAAMMGGRRAEPDISDVWENVDGGLKFPYSDIRHRLHTGKYLSSVLLRWVGPADANANGANEPHPFAKWLPTLIFILAGFTAFATGTSWGTMGIVMPLAIPLVGSLLSSGGPVDPNDPIFLATIAGVLAGAIFGDHCSPISDTTVLSSNASGCDHLAHVWTQMPYAIAVFLVSIVCGTLPVGFGVPWWICMPVGTVVLVGIMYFVGQPVEIDASSSSDNQSPPK